MAWLASVCLFLSSSLALPQGTGPTPTATLWQPVEFSFAGPSFSEDSSNPNPFLALRLQGNFRSPDGRLFSVPGFFDGDGQGGATGNVWKVRFTPDQLGLWTWTLNFRSGPNLALDLDPSAGTPVNGLHGLTGFFQVFASGQEAEGFHAKGPLLHDGGYYLRFADGTTFLKGGTDSPENFLAYDGFDGTYGPASHQFAPHVQDWRSGDPDWGNGQGKGIIGALNYLSSVGVNSIYCLLMNIGGDGQDVWPYLGVDPSGDPLNDNLHFDLSKLTQWNLVFHHAQRKGLLLNLVLNEAEAANKRELDDGLLGVERKLYYREMVARFAHHNGLVWNLCEEYDIKHPFTPEEIRSFADYLAALDPYDHPITVHQFEDPMISWTPFLGDDRFSLTSFQYAQDPTAGFGSEVEHWRSMSLAAGHPIPICLDEIRMTTLSNFNEQRRELIWPTYVSGGHIEFILSSLLLTEDFRAYEPLWDSMRYARELMEWVPYSTMKARDELLQGSGQEHCLAKEGEQYLIYLPDGGDVLIDLRSSRYLDQFRVDWFNTRTGTYSPGTVIRGAAWRSLGTPSFPNDVACLVRRTDLVSNIPPSLDLTVSSQALVLLMQDADGSEDLDLDDLDFEVDNQDQSASLLEAIQNGQATMDFPDGETIRIVYPVDLSQASIAALICDRSGMCAGDTHNK